MSRPRSIDLDTIGVICRLPRNASKYEEHQQERAVTNDAEAEHGSAVDGGRHGQSSGLKFSQDTSECQFTKAPVGFGFHAQTCSV